MLVVNNVIGELDFLKAIQLLFTTTYGCACLG